MSTVGSARRYYLGKRRQAHERGELALESVWEAKQQAEAGTPLADDFPYRARLVAAFYETNEDLIGADAEELAPLGFSAREAATILAELSG